MRTSALRGHEDPPPSPLRPLPRQERALTLHVMRSRPADRAAVIECLSADDRSATFAAEAAILMQKMSRRKIDRHTVEVIRHMKAHLTGMNVNFRMVMEIMFLAHEKADFKQNGALDDVSELECACKFVFRTMCATSRKVQYMDQWVDFVVCNTNNLYRSRMTKYRFCAWIYEEFFMDARMKLKIALPWKFFFGETQRRLGDATGRAKYLVGAVAEGDVQVRLVDEGAGQETEVTDSGSPTQAQIEQCAATTIDTPPANNGVFVTESDAPGVFVDGSAQPEDGSGVGVGDGAGESVELTSMDPVGN